MNRLVRPIMFAFEPDVVKAFAKVSFGASGTPTLDTTNSKGLCNVTRNSTGNFTFTFGSQFTPFKRLDTYVKLLGLSHNFDESVTGSAPAAPSMCLTANNVSNSSLASVTLQFNSGGSATDPASGEICRLAFDLCRSTAI